MLHLRSSLSFCEVDGRYVFLDLAADRYLCLAGALESDWRAILAGNASASQAEAAKARNLIVDESGGPIAPCPAHIAQETLLDGPENAFSWSLAAGLWREVGKTGRRLRRQGLTAATAPYLHCKRTRGGIAANEAELARIARHFARLDLISTTVDQCLSRSLALGTYLARRGYLPEVVFAVRLGPFRAHCWVECQGYLVNDRFDRVRIYQPILRL